MRLTRRGRIAALCFLVALGAVHLDLVRSLPSTLQRDSLSVYLPGAERLLAEGLAFYASADALRTAPLNFIWPAMLGADPDSIVSANLLLTSICLVLIFLTARSIAGVAGGIAAAVLYGLSPLVAPLFTTVLSEPLFLAGTLLWIHGTTQCVLRGDRWLGVAALGGIVSVMTRPVWLPFLSLSLPVLLALWWARRAEPAWRRLALVHLMILAPVGAYCLHNALQFGFFGVSTGGGTALYLGNHPLTHGVEPNFLLLDYDVPSVLVPWQGDHLSIAGDRALRAIGWSLIGDRSFSEQVEWLLYKLGATLFFTKADFAPDVHSIRALRVFECAFAVFGLGRVRSEPLRRWFAGALALQICQLTMVLYNPRYSVGALEPWFIVLAGCGVASLAAGLHARISGVPYGLRLAVDLERSAASVLPRIALVVAVAIGIGVGHWHRRLTDPIQPNITRAPMKTLLQLTQPQVDASHSANIVPLPNGAYFVTEQDGLFAIEIPAPLHPTPGLNQVWSLALTIVPPKGKTCRGGRISYESAEPRPDTPFMAIPIELKGDGKYRHYAISAAHPLSPLHPASQGILRLRPFCPKDTQVAIHKVSLLESKAHVHYLQRALAP